MMSTILPGEHSVDFVQVDTSLKLLRPMILLLAFHSNFHPFKRLFILHDKSIVRRKFWRIMENL